MGAFKRDSLIDMDDKKEFTNKMKGTVLLGKKALQRPTGKTWYKVCMAQVV